MIDHSVVVHPLLGDTHIVYWVLCWVHVLWCSVSHPRGAVLGLRSVIVTLSAILNFWSAAIMVVVLISLRSYADWATSFLFT